MNRSVLCRPFDPAQIRTRPGQHGKEISYVDIAAVIGRLNEGCESWSFEVVSYKIHEGEVIVLGKLTADGVTKTHFGGSAITLDREGRVLSVADDLKAAASDALKKCASLFGVALELYGGAKGNPGRLENRHANGAPTTDGITSRQLATIQSACRRKGWSSNHLTVLVDERFGKNNPQALTRSEASSLISELTAANGH